MITTENTPNRKPRALVISSYPAPYRVAVFRDLAKVYDLDVFFREGNNENRNEKWFPKSGEFRFYILDDEETKKLFSSKIKHIREYDFVIPYDVTSKAAIQSICLCRLFHIPYYVNCDGAILRKNLLRDIVKRFLFRGAAGCFSSGKTADMYFEYYGVKKEKIFHHVFTSLTDEDILAEPVDKESKKKIRQQLGLPVEKRIVLSVGRFIPVKGFPYLIKAWSEIKSDALLIIIGGGEEKELYQNHICELGAKNIQILDFMEKDELSKYYLAADAFALLTLGDVWGLVINEAMAYGLPVLTTYTCVAGVELIEEGINGYLVDANAVEDVKVALERLIHDEELCASIGKNNIRKIQNATIDNIAKSHIEAIEKTYRRRR